DYTWMAELNQRRVRSPKLAPSARKFFTTRWPCQADLLLLPWRLGWLLDLLRLAMRYQVSYIVNEYKDNQHHQEDEANLHHPLFSGSRQGQADESQDRFQQEHEYQAAVQDRDGQEIEDPQVER